MDSPESIRFSSFEKYCRVIPDLKLPYDFLDISKIDSYSENMSFCIQNTNFGHQSYKPIAKIIQKNYISIVYSVPTSSTVYELYTFKFSGSQIDKTMIFFLEDPEMGLEDDCTTKINTNMEIQMDYKIIHHDSLDSKKIIETKDEKTLIKIDLNGKIEIRK
jgi:hypothetical protein